MSGNGATVYTTDMNDADNAVQVEPRIKVSNMHGRVLQGMLWTKCCHTPSLIPSALLPALRAGGHPSTIDFNRRVCMVDLFRLENIDDWLTLL